MSPAISSSSDDEDMSMFASVAVSGEDVLQAATKAAAKGKQQGGGQNMGGHGLANRNRKGGKDEGDGVADAPDDITQLRVRV